MLSTLRKIVVLALLAGSVCDNTIPSILEDQLMLFSCININISRKASSILVALFHVVNLIEYVVNLSLILVYTPYLLIGVVLRFDATIDFILVNFDQLIAILVKLLDICDCRIHKGFNGPIHMQYSTKSAKIHNHCLKLSIFIYFNNQASVAQL